MSKNLNSEKTFKLNFFESFFLLNAQVQICIEAWPSFHPFKCTLQGVQDLLVVVDIINCFLFLDFHRSLQ